MPLMLLALCLTAAPGVDTEPEKPPPREPGRAILSIGVGLGAARTDHGRWLLAPPLGRTSLGESRISFAPSAHVRLGMRKGLLDVGVLGEVAGPYEPGTQLLTTLDVGLSTVSPSRQLSARVSAGAHSLRFADVQPQGEWTVTLPAVGMELELRTRDFTDPGGHPWLALSLYALVDVVRTRGPAFSRATMAGGYVFGLRFRLGFDVT